jgi:RNA polymerase sigma-70 factor (ECF subfamily)
MTRAPDEAADLAQATFVRGFSDLAHCHHPERVGAWLFRICVNLCRDHLKAPRRRDLSLQDVSTPMSDDRDLTRAVELREGLDRALATLPAEQREAFLLKHEDGYSYEDMSRLLGEHVPALKMRVHRARAALQESLQAFAP